MADPIVAYLSLHCDTVIGMDRVRKIAPALLGVLILGLLYWYNTDSIVPTIMQTNQKTHTSDYTIFTAEVARAGKFYPIARDNFAEFFTPTEHDIELVQQLIRAQKPTLDSYLQQYYGVVERDGRRVVHMHSFAKENEGNLPDWRTRIIYVKDGGKGYLDAAVDLGAREVLFAEFHGNA